MIQLNICICYELMGVFSIVRVLLSELGSFGLLALPVENLEEFVRDLRRILSALLRKYIFLIIGKRQRSICSMELYSTVLVSLK